jgi:hypothetical protein
MPYGPPLIKIPFLGFSNTDTFHTVKRTKTRTATIYVDENDIMHIIMHEGVRLDYEDALDNSLVMKNLSGNKPMLKLVDSRNSWKIDRKAREFVGSKEVRENTIARAVVKNSFISIILAGFFSKLNAPKVPTKVFTDYDEAYEWLLSMRK